MVENLDKDFINTNNDSFFDFNIYDYSNIEELIEDR